MGNPNTIGENDALNLGAFNVRTADQSQEALQGILAQRGVTVTADAHHDAVRADINGLPDKVVGMDAGTRASISALLLAAGQDDGAGLDEVAA